MRKHKRLLSSIDKKTLRSETIIKPFLVYLICVCVSKAEINH